MKKFLILLLSAMILFSGCVEKNVKNGDNITVNYIGRFQDGKVFDTSIESVAKANGLFNPGARYEPLKFTVGNRKVIQGFDEGVIGMKVGETKVLTIPPEKAYPINPDKIQVGPIIQHVPATTIIPKVFEIPFAQFEQFFGQNHSAGDTVKIPDTNINITIKNISSKVSLTYDLNVGYDVWDARAPWNETVVKIDDTNITLKPKVKKNDIIQFPKYPWNTTVIDVNNENITLRHNPIPETTITVPGMFGQMVPMKISFNETSIIMDQNPEVAGKTLIFNVTLISIDR
jgi:FKBP-type peptidyl-prolyl cis-trans isomerase 2